MESNKKLTEILSGISIERLKELVEADKEGRCIILDKPPSNGTKYTIRSMCMYCKDNYRISPQCFNLKKCRAKILEEIPIKK